MIAKKKISIEDFKKDKVLSEHTSKSLEVARALDANAPRLPYSRVLTSYEFEDFIGELTSKRLELLRLAARHAQSSISELAEACQRHQSSVSKDIARLQGLGLVQVELVANAGHGRKKVVTRIADRISINADFSLAT
jgi:predicted transcriptional regulator